MFKKRNKLGKLWLKYTDRQAYRNYKWDLASYSQQQFEECLINAKKVNSIEKIRAITDKSGRLNLMHSGNAGDVIYALPTIKKIKELTGAHISLYLRLGQPMLIDSRFSHPLGGVMLNEKMAEMLFPLLKSQTYIGDCEIYNGQTIDIDLDYFRSGSIPMDKGNIARWCSYITGITPDLWKSWLKVESADDYSESIFIARSARYQNKSIDFSFLNQYSNLKFIGVESEFKAMKQALPKLEWVQVKDFLQMAQVIAGCKFFIGNQSFPYSVAEALKIPRILEVTFDMINVVPEGENGHDFFFQEHFESLVKNLNIGTRLS